MLFLVLVADFFVLVLVIVNGIVIFSFLVIFVFVFVNENHTAFRQTHLDILSMCADMHSAYLLRQRVCPSVCPSQPVLYQNDETYLKTFSTFW